MFYDSVSMEKFNKYIYICQISFPTPTKGILEISKINCCKNIQFNRGVVDWIKYF